MVGRTLRPRQIVFQWYWIISCKSHTFVPWQYGVIHSLVVGVGFLLCRGVFVHVLVFRACFLWGFSNFPSFGVLGGLVFWLASYQLRLLASLQCGRCVTFLDISLLLFGFLSSSFFHVVLSLRVNKISFYQGKNKNMHELQNCAREKGKKGHWWNLWY